MKTKSYTGTPSSLDVKQFAVGLDLSLTGTGLSILNAEGEIVTLQTIKSKPLGDTPLLDLKRITELRDKILGIVESFVSFPKSDVVCAIEGPSFMSQGTSLVQLGALSYGIREGIGNMGCTWVIVAPSSLKKFTTGKGNAEKQMMLLEVFKRWGVSAETNDEADSYSLSRIAWNLLLERDGDTEAQREVIELISKQF